MKHATRRWFAPSVLGCVFAAGCSTAPTPVPVRAGASEMQQLVGEWEGEYSSEATGRSGTIVFKLIPGEAQAQGDVLMIARGSSEPYRAVESSPGRARADSQLLTIRFVAASEGAVTGTLAPYLDPDCDCEVETTFTGNLTGDRIDGTFTSVSSRGAGRTGGRWQATRKRGS